MDACLYGTSLSSLMTDKAKWISYSNILKLDVVKLHFKAESAFLLFSENWTIVLQGDINDFRLNKMKMRF